MEMQKFGGLNNNNKVDLINEIKRKYPQLKYTTQLWRFSKQELQNFLAEGKDINQIVKKVMTYENAKKKYNRYRKEIKKELLEELICFIKENEQITIKELLEKLEKEK